MEDGNVVIPLCYSLVLQKAALKQQNKQTKPDHSLITLPCFPTILLFPQVRGDGASIPEHSKGKEGCFPILLFLKMKFCSKVRWLMMTKNWEDESVNIDYSG